MYINIKKKILETKSSSKRMLEKYKNLEKWEDYSLNKNKIWKYKIQICFSFFF